QLVGGGPKILSADLSVIRPKRWLPLPPSTAPIPSGTCLDSTRTPCLVPYLVMKRGPRTWLALLIAVMGIPWTILLAQWPPVLGIALLSAAMPESPSNTVYVSNLRRS